MSGVDDTNGRNGTHCGYIYDGGTGGWSDIVQTISVSPNTTYTLSCYVQTDGTFPAQGSVGVRRSDGTVIAQQGYGQMSDYTPLAVTFNSGSSSTVVIFAGFSDQGPGAWIHVDDWGLTGGNTPPPPPSGVIADPSYENQTQPAGAPLIPPWSGEGPALSGVDDTNGRNGTHCGYIYDGGTGGWSDIMQTISVSPNTTYTLSCFIQTDGAFPAQGSVGVRTNAGAVLAQQGYGQMSDYAPLAITFNSGSSSTLVIFAGFTDQGPGAWIHVDDWSLSVGSTPPPPPGSGAIKDPSYETQTQAPGAPLIAPWGSNGPALVGVDDTNGRNGTHCAYIYDGGTGAWSDIVQGISVSPNTTYTLSCFIQTDGAFPAQGLMGAYVGNGNILGSQSFGQMSDYGHITVTFNSGPNTSVVIFAGFTDQGAGAWIHVDDWSLSP